MRGRMTTPKPIAFAAVAASAAARIGDIRDRLRRLSQIERQLRSSRRRFRLAAWRAMRARP
jgi:hypothetical protein